jgi:hypothetical protein
VNEFQATEKMQLTAEKLRTKNSWRNQIISKVEDGVH